MTEFTKEKLVSDIILRISKGKPSDDLELEPSQVEFWIDQILPALVQTSLNQKILNKLGIDQSFIKIEECVEPKVKILDCRDCQNNVYIDLECAPVDLIRDSGMVRVATEDGDWVDQVTLHELDDITKLRFSKPSLKNIKYTRVKQRLYLHGLNTDTYHLAKFNIAYIPVPTVQGASDTDPIYISDELLKPLADELEALARRQIYQSDIDEANNARQDLNIQAQ